MYELCATSSFFVLRKDLEMIYNNLENQILNTIDTFKFTLLPETCYFKLVNKI